MHRRWSVRVGQVAGIDIRIHASMLLLLWIVVASASQTEGGLGAGLVWIVTIFLCVLVHEFSHSLTARRFGVGVREIELLPIGGVSKFDAIPDKPREELAIALAGPLASLAIGAAALTVVTVLRGGLPAPALAGGAFWTRFAWFNLVIGLFNLLPALPLDGGRVLRAFLEMREGPLGATHHAARLGRLFALAMIIFGVFSGQFFIAIIGLFISVVSRAEEVSAEFHDRLAHLLVADVMVHAPLFLSENESARDVLWMLTESSQRQFPVTNVRGDLVGMVSARQLVQADPGALIASLVQPRPAVSASMRLDECGTLEAGSAIPVVDVSGRVIGLLHADDVMLAVRRSFAQPHQKQAA